MEIKYEAHKPNRIKSRFSGFTTFELDWWYCKKLKRWGKSAEFDGGYSSHQPCKSIKAFRRLLKKAPCGVTFVLCSRYLGHNVTGVGSNKAYK